MTGVRWPRTPSLIPPLPGRSEQADAVHPAPLWVALMQFTADDDFYDDPDLWDLPDCAVALVTRGGSWSARNQKDGFVPESMIARFTSDPVQAVRALASRKAARRVKGGILLIRWERWLAPATAEEAEALERRKAADRDRQQRQRDRKKAEAGTPPRKRGRPAKPQVENASRDGITHHVTPVIDRSDQGLNPRGESQNPGQDQSQDQDQGLLSDHDRNRTPRVIAATVKALWKKADHPVSDDDALFAITVLEVRAEKASTVIHDPEKYFPAAARREVDITALLPGVMPPVEATPDIDAPPPWEATAQDDDRHEYIPGPNDRCAGCTMPQANRTFHFPPRPQARTACTA